jgi:hypothetical protein
MVLVLRTFSSAANGHRASVNLVPSASQTSAAAWNEPVIHSHTFFSVTFVPYRRMGKTDHESEFTKTGCEVERQTSRIPVNVSGSWDP